MAIGYGDETAALRQQLALARGQLRQLGDTLERFKARPYVGGIVADVRDGRVLLWGANQCISVEMPTADVVDPKEVVPGAIAMLDGDSNAIRGIVEQAAIGKSQIVKRAISKWTVELEDGKVVLCPPRFGVKPDDRVIVDNFISSVVVENLGREPSSQVYAEPTGIDWDDVGGLEDAKRLLIEAIEEPIKHAKLYKRYGKKSAKGLLLHGPPGTGKTLLGKAAATAVARAHGKAHAGGFIYVKGPELLSKWIGESEGNVRRLFKTARMHKERHGVPAVLLLDECDALLGKRGGNRAVEGMERVIVPQFASEMDGLDESAAIVILTTNRPDILDSSIVRAGRIDRKIYVGRPTQQAARQIVEIHARRKPAGGDFAAAVVAELYSPRHVLFMIRCESGGDQRMVLGDLVSGAMCEDAVERSTQLAIRRARAGDDTGLTAEDAKQAVAEMVIEEKQVDHAADIEDFVDGLGLRRVFKGWEKAA